MDFNQKVNLTMHVCNDCVGDKILADQVKEDDTPVKCTYCGSMGAAVTLKKLANRIHEAMEEHFDLTPPYPVTPDETLLAQDGSWERRGNYVEDVIARIAGVNTQIAADVREYLADRFGHQANPDEKDENPYNPFACYEERATDTSDFRQTWMGFRDEIHSHARFFGTGTEARLDEIFADLYSLSTYHGERVIREIQPGDPESFIWRARIANSESELKSILNSLSTELGPPPPETARAGRINAQGISVFYGALEESTCVSELRASVGSHVAIGKFEVLNSIRILDLAALSEVYSKISYFSPGYSEQRNREAFLSQLVREISRPIMPRDETLEYLATQVVAEYLANRINPSIQGMIFPSSQTGERGRNLVLFKEACNVERLKRHPGSTPRVVLPRPRRIDVEDEPGEYLVLGTQQPDSADTDASAKGPARYDPRTARKEQEPTLRLEMLSVKVLTVTAVNYKYNEAPVRHVTNLSFSARAGEPTVNISLSVENPD